MISYFWYTFWTISSNICNWIRICSIGTLLDQEAAGQETESISNQIIQARDDIENELKKQGEIMGNEIKEQFGFENIQTNLTRHTSFHSQEI